MTFLEKAKEDNKQFDISKLKHICPEHIGLENDSPCEIYKGNCEMCWNREMPNTDKSILLSIGENYESSVVKKIKEQEEKMVRDIVNECLNNTEPQFSNPVIEKAYNTGLEDAWELAKNIWGGNDSENEKIFGTKYVYEIYKLSPQEALVKLKAYEEAQKIEVGDVVKYGNTEYVVCSIFEDFSAHKPNYCGVDRKGRWLGENNVTKTGKHIDVKSILEQIGE